MSRRRDPLPMTWSVTTWVLVAAGGILLFFSLQLVYLAGVLLWEDQRTRGLGYFGLPPAERDRFKRALRNHSRLLWPILRLTALTSRFTFERASFRYRDIAGPKGTCSKESFERAHQYHPRPEDIFVVTQMKCGTTWMQHVVYQILERGEGDLVESGRTLYAVSPWLESLKSVSVDDAPLIGSERRSRLIKTHFPSTLCPYTSDSRYVYVARHPVSCFASCADFIAANLGVYTPGLELTESWFRSEELMWWGTWPAHVKGWWDRTRTSDNVLFVHFEDMKRDLAATVRQVAEFLGVTPLTPHELDQVVQKCGFAYMQRHADAFEMHPPHLLAVDAELFRKGSADRYRDVPEAMRQRILGWSAKALEGVPFPGVTS